MSITQGLFSDVLANAPQPQGGSADWSRTLPMAGAVDWANVRPFQVINPLTGYNYGATQPTQASSSDTKGSAPQLSEYQKWLAQQSQQKTMGSETNPQRQSYEGMSDPYNTAWTNMSDEDKAKKMAEASEFERKMAGLFQNFWGGTELGKLQENLAPGLQARMKQIYQGVNPLTGQSYLDDRNVMLANQQAGAISGPSYAERVAAAQTPVGAAIAANPMGLDPAQQAALAEAVGGSAGANAPSGGYTGGGGYSVGTGGYGKPGEAGGGYATGGGWN